MRRREFLGALGCATAAWPRAATAQQREPVRRVGVLTGGAGPDSKARIAVFVQAMQQLGWTEGTNLQLEIRQGGGNTDAIRKYAAELVAWAPDVIMTIGGTATGFLLVATRSVPIVFTIVPDPVGSGFVESLSRPGGNATGFLQFEYSFGAKWVELLKEIGPKLVRVAVLRDASLPAGVGQFAVIQSVAPPLGIEVSPVNVRNAAEIERGLTAFARATNSGLIVASSTSALVNRDMIIALASKYKLPAVYAQREFVAAGGLLSYSADFPAQFRSAAGYVNRILKGEKPADLPVQGPTKYNLVINLKTAKALGFTIPPQLLIRADELIE
jgi:putative ABC transport system substrate-binding protein